MFDPKNADALQEGKARGLATRLGAGGGAQSLEQAFRPEEMAALRALWLVQSGGVPPVNGRQLITSGLHMTNNPRWVGLSGMKCAFMLAR